MRSTAPILFLLALGGCSSCEGAPVPFGLDGGRRSDSVTVSPGTTAPRARPAIVARALPEGSTRAEVEGAALEIAGESLRAIGAWDLDGDGDRDAITITGGGPTQGPRVLVAMREGATLSAPIEIASSAPLVGCTIDRTDVRTEADAIVIAELDATCPPDELGADRALHAFVLGAGARPRALERFVLRAKHPEDRLRVRAEDRDRDGVIDLVADLTFGVVGIETASDVSLGFLDRPAGLARDPSEPEQRIAALAQEARGQLRRHRDRARAQSSRAVALYDAICRESGRARLEVGGAPGIVCGRSAGAGRALAVLAQSSAREDPLRAIEALERLSSAAVQVREAERDAARTAVEAITDASLTVREGPIAIAPSEPGPRLSTLAFVDEDHLLVRGAGARLIDLASGTETPAGDRGALALTDPSGAHRLVGIERRCEGTVLVIGSTSELVGAIAPRATALLAPRRAPAGASCPDLTPALRTDADGWVALGWAPQGVLAARGTELRIVPLDIAGHAAGAPSVLDPGAIVPAPIAPGHATSDVRAYAIIQPHGIVLVDLAGERDRAVLRPAGWVAPEGTAIDVAVSPSTRRIAWIAGGHLRWIERATPTP